MSTAAPTAPSPAPGQKRVREPAPAGYWVVWTTVVIDLIGFGIAIPVLGLFAKEHGATAFQVGLIGAAFSLAQFVVSPILGRLSDRIGRKKVLMLSLIGTCIASLATGLASAPWLIMAARAFDGASGATLGVAQAAVADIAPPHRRAPLLGMLGAAFGVGFTIGPAIAGIASWLGNARTPFFVASALAGANAIATAIRFKDTRRVETSNDENSIAESASTLAKTWRENQLPRFIAISALSGFSFVMFEQMFALYGQDRIHFTKTTASVAFVIIGVAVSIVQGGLVSRAIAALGEHRLLLVGMIAVTAGLILTGFTRSWWMLVPALLLLSVGQGFASPTMQSSITNRIADTKRGELLGIVQRWGSLARVIGPLVAGFLYGHVGKSAPFFIGAALYVVCLAGLATQRAK
jgi:MFS transporter, DHA1 family, tetracycline resistance protein